MISSDKTPTHNPFAGFNVGAVISALLLAFGIESLVVAVEEPLASAVIGALNWVIVQRLNTSPIQQVSFSWIIASYAGVSGIISLLLGYKLASWVTGGRRHRNNE
jgi:hypothetical protein